MDLNENDSITITMGSALGQTDFQPRMTYERMVAEWAADWAAKRSSLPYEAARDEIELALANAKPKPISASAHNAATFMRVAGKLIEDQRQRAKDAKKKAAREKFWLAQPLAIGFGIGAGPMAPEDAFEPFVPSADAPYPAFIKAA